MPGEVLRKSDMGGFFWTERGKPDGKSRRYVIAKAYCQRDTEYRVLQSLRPPLRRPHVSRGGRLSGG